MLVAVGCGAAIGVILFLLCCLGWGLGKFIYWAFA
jgi:hypothetical protein